MILITGIKSTVFIGWGQNPSQCLPSNNNQGPSVHSFSLLRANHMIFIDVEKSKLEGNLEQADKRIL